MDSGFTVCDNAAGEVCPVWLSQSMTAHWGIPDPAVVKGGDEDKRKGFLSASIPLQHRLSVLVSLPMDQLDRLAPQRRLDEIGKRKD